MTRAYPDHIWHNGKIKPWAEATTHVMSHALHYGSSVFEGIRCYDTPDGPVIFRLNDHNKRLFASAKIYDMAIPYGLDEINAACREVIKANDFTTDYLRPVAYRGLGGFGLSADTPTDVAVATWKMGQYLGALEKILPMQRADFEEKLAELTGAARRQPATVVQLDGRKKAPPVRGWRGC